MNELNATLRILISFALAPFAGWPPLVPLVFWSAVLGVVMAVVFRFTSPQKRLRRVADLSRAEVLAIKLFKDEPRVMFCALGRLLRHTTLRLWYSLPPVLVMAVPFTLLLAHLAVWYEHRPLLVGESAIVELEEKGSGVFSARLAPREEKKNPDPFVTFVIETEPLRDDPMRTISWRIRAAQPGAVQLRWQLGEKIVEKQFVIAEGARSFCPVSVRRAGGGFWDRLLYPGEPAFAADDQVRGIVITYPRRSMPVFGWDVPWWATLMIVSIISALVVRPWVKVQF